MLSLHLDFVWAPGIEGLGLDRVEVDREKPDFAPVGPAGAFGGAREVTPHLASGRTDLFPVQLKLADCCAAPLLETLKG